MMFLVLAIFCCVSINTAEDCPKTFTQVKRACHKMCSELYNGYYCPPETEPGCVCDKAYFMTNNWTCVHMFDCPLNEVKCPENQVYSWCHSCPNTCEQMYQSNKCTLVCRNTCDCKPGYFKNGKDECVLARNCPPEEIICPDGLMVRCGNGAIPTCESSLKPLAKSDGECVPTCACPDDNTVYNSQTGKCILPLECEFS